MKRENSSKNNGNHWLSSSKKAIYSWLANVTPLLWAVDRD